MHSDCAFSRLSDADESESLQLDKLSVNLGKCVRFDECVDLELGRWRPGDCERDLLRTRP